MTRAAPSQVKVESFGGDGAGRPWLTAMMRGMRKKCPRCGAGRLFAGYTRTADDCDACGLAISGHRADDAPPYLTVMIVGHAAIPLALAQKQLFDPPLGLQFAIWLPVIIVASALLLPMMKGAMVGVQWANRLHGFGDGGPDADA